MSTCTACHDNPVHDTFVCERCMDRLHGHIAEAPTLARELRVDIAKLGRKGDGQPHARFGVERPLVFDPHASRVADELRTALVTAVRIVALDQADRMPANNIPAICAWLATNEAAIALRPEGGDICHEIEQAVRRARRVIDTPPERVYIGDCECDGNPSLYAVRSQVNPTTGERPERTHRCRECQRVWNVEERLAELREDCRDVIVDRDQLRALMVGMGVREGLLRLWIHRGRLLPVFHGGDTYRYGEAIDLAEQMVTKRGA